MTQQIDGAGRAMVQIQFMCPSCKGTLHSSFPSNLACGNCGAQYEVRGGIPIIRENHSFYYGLLPQHSMQALIQQGEEIGWFKALENEFAREHEERAVDLFQLFMDENRAAFKVLLSSPHGRVLDLGCGSGSTAIGLSRWFDEVVACDLTYERVAFLALRTRQLGLSNVSILCAGDTRPLPFSDASFDAVVLNGVLEWSAGTGPRPVGEKQLEFLREVRRILKSNGHAYIGIENRLGFRYFMGAPEDHTGVTFASVAPRWLADILVQRAKGYPYRTYTYSWVGYKRLLQEAGFSAAQFYGTLPDYRGFTELVPLERPSEEVWRRNGTWRRRIRRYLERSKWFTPSFGIVASVRETSQSWLDGLAEHVSKKLGIAERMSISKVHVSSGGVGVIALCGNVLLRVPRDVSDVDRIQRNFDGLQAAQKVLQEVIVPVPLLKDNYEGVLFTTESRLPGKLLDELQGNERRAAERDMFNSLLVLKQIKYASLPEGRYQHWKRYVIEPLDEALNTLTNERHRRLLREILEIAEKIVDPNLPLGFSHGDFWWGNILVMDETKSIGLVDWDRWAERDFITHDLLHFLSYRRVLRDNASWAMSLKDLFYEEKVDEEEASWVVQFAKQSEMSAAWKSEAALAYWVREVVAPMIAAKRDRRWLRENFLEVLEWFHHRLITDSPKIILTV